MKLNVRFKEDISTYHFVGYLDSISHFGGILFLVFVVFIILRYVFKAFFTLNLIRVI